MELSEKTFKINGYFKSREKSWKLVSAMSHFDGKNK